LALTADVEQSGTEAEGDAEAGRDQRAREAQRLTEGADALHEGVASGVPHGTADERVHGVAHGGPGCGEEVARAREDVSEGLQHGLVGEDEEQDAHHDSEDERGEGPDQSPGGERPDQHVGAGRGCGKILTHDFTPAMSRPSFSRGVSAGTMSMIEPWYMTAMRSARALTSSSSVEMISTGTPESRTAMMRSWMNSIDPTSTPRVGCEATRSFRSRASSRASTTFCWFPPDR